MLMQLKLKINILSTLALFEQKLPQLHTTKQGCVNCQYHKVFILQYIHLQTILIAWPVSEELVALC